MRKSKITLLNKDAKRTEYFGFHYSDTQVTAEIMADIANYHRHGEPCLHLGYGPTIEINDKTNSIKNENT